MDDFFPIRLKLRNRRPPPIENITDCMSDRHGYPEAFFLDEIETGSLSPSFLVRFWTNKKNQ